jgi:hypothetical protein
MMFPKPNHKRGKRNKKERAEFSKETRQEIVERYDGRCGHCGGEGHHIHHVYGKGRGGRGTPSNGILLCFKCHERIHREPGLMRFYIDQFTTTYGDRFWQDEDDKKGM